MFTLGAQTFLRIPASLPGVFTVMLIPNITFVLRSEACVRLFYQDDKVLSGKLNIY